MTSPSTPAQPATETSFPRLSARTGRFTLGTPRPVGLAHDGRTLVFLRSRSGTDRTGLLWALDLDSGVESLLADPTDLLHGDPEELSDAERSRRERSRESGVGIVAATLDEAGATLAFTLSSRLFLLDLPRRAPADSPTGAVAGRGGTGLPAATRALAAAGGAARELPARSPVIDPRLDPQGRWIAYASGGELRVSAVDGSGDRALLVPDAAAVSWGVAEFVAAEEIGRRRGFWWAPDGSALLVARVDESPVAVRVVSDPAAPRRAAREERYPFAGTANAEVTLWWVPLPETATRDTTDNTETTDTTEAAGAAGGAARDLAVRVDWDTAALPYLAAVSWTAAGPPLLTVQSRDQRDQRVLTVDPSAAGAVSLPSTAGAVPTTGATAGAAAPVPRGLPTRELGRDRDAAWVELVPGVPAWGPGGSLLTVVADAATDTYRLAADGVPVSPPGAQVAAVLDAGPEDVLLVVQDDPVTADVATLTLDGVLVRLTGPRSGPASPAAVGSAAARSAVLGGRGVHSAIRGGGTVVLSRTGLEQVPTAVVVRRPGAADLSVATLALSPTRLPVPELLELGPHRLRAWLLLPSGPVPSGRASLPVLLDPYGGPGAAMVVASARRLLESQWWADQGFAVLVTDGRGTPGRGPAFDREVLHDFAGVTLDDQVEALTAAAALHPELDLDRVAMRGWSFGGYLSALAVLRRPDVFAAAVAGAPPTDWHLYDTHYTERYLGHPDHDGDVYRRNDLLHLAPGLRRPLMIIHGLADDNVLVAHSLALSNALLEAGRPHTFLPLSGITHMATAETVAENLLDLQLDFLRSALARTREPVG